MKTILKQILNELNDDNSIDLNTIDWDALTLSVRDAGLNKNSDYNDIKDVIMDLLESDHPNANCPWN
jgi:hypothetical protein